MKPLAPLALLLSLLLSLLGVGCPPKGHVRPAGTADYENAKALLSAMRAARLGSLRVSGTIDMRRGTQRVKAHMIYLAKQPAWLRFETESFFDQPLSILVTDGMTFSAWDLKAGRFARGPATPANVSQIIPVPLDGSEVAGVLMGDPPLIPYARAELTWDEDASAHLLTLSDARQEQYVLVHPGHLRPLRVWLKQKGKLVYDLHYEKWLIEQGQAVAPGKILFEMPADEIRLKIRIREAEASPQLADDLFRLDPPDGIQIENWQ